MLSSIFQMDISCFKIDIYSMIYNSIWIFSYIDKVSSNIVMDLLILSDIVWYSRISTNIVIYCHISFNIISYFQIFLDSQIKSIIVRCAFRYPNVIYIQHWHAIWESLVESESLAGQKNSHFVTFCLVCYLRMSHKKWKLSCHLITKQSFRHFLN